MEHFFEYFLEFGKLPDSKFFAKNFKVDFVTVNIPKGIQKKCSTGFEGVSHEN